MKKKLVAILSLLLLSCALLMADGTVPSPVTQNLNINGTVYAGSDITDPVVPGGPDEPPLPPIFQNDGLNVYLTYQMPGAVSSTTTIAQTKALPDTNDPITVDLNQDPTAKQPATLITDLDICIWAAAQAPAGETALVEFSVVGFTKAGGSASVASQYQAIELDVTSYDNGDAAITKMTSVDDITLTTTGSNQLDPVLVGSCNLDWTRGAESPVLEAGSYSATLTIQISGN